MRRALRNACMCSMSDFNQKLECISKINKASPYRISCKCLQLFFSFYMLEEVLLLTVEFAFDLGTYWRIGKLTFPCL